MKNTIDISKYPEWKLTKYGALLRKTKNGFRRSNEKEFSQVNKLDYNLVREWLTKIRSESIEKVPIGKRKNKNSGMSPFMRGLKAQEKELNKFTNSLKDQGFFLSDKKEMQIHLQHEIDNSFSVSKLLYLYESVTRMDKAVLIIPRVHFILKQKYVINREFESHNKKLIKDRISYLYFMADEHDLMILSRYFNKSQYIQNVLNKFQENSDKYKWLKACIDINENVYAKYLISKDRGKRVDYQSLESINVKHSIKLLKSKDPVDIDLGVLVFMFNLLNEEGVILDRDEFKSNDMISLVVEILDKYGFVIDEPNNKVGFNLYHKFVEARKGKMVYGREMSFLREEGYRVGVSSSLSEDQRRTILRDCLMTYDRNREHYNIGKPATGKRFVYIMNLLNSDVLKFSGHEYSDYTLAIQHLELDMEWLMNNFTTSGDMVFIKM